MTHKSKGQVESEISEAVIRFEKEYMGRGPRETRALVIDDMVFVRLKGVLTPAEEQLAKSEDGADLIKRTRSKLLESARPLLERLMLDLTGCDVVSLHTDISTRSGERIIIFVLSGNLEQALLPKKA